MNVLDILSFCQENKIRTIIQIGPQYPYDFKSWEVTLAKQADGVYLSITKNGTLVESALQAAYDAWQKATDKGLPEMRPLELTVEPPAINYDEIPF